MPTPIGPSTTLGPESSRFVTLSQLGDVLNRVGAVEGGLCGLHSGMNATDGKIQSIADEVSRMQGELNHMKSLMTQQNTNPQRAGGHDKRNFLSSNGFKALKSHSSEDPASYDMWAFKVCRALQSYNGDFETLLKWLDTMTEEVTETLVNQELIHGTFNMFEDDLVDMDRDIFDLLSSKTEGKAMQTVMANAHQGKCKGMLTWQKLQRAVKGQKGIRLQLLTKRVQNPENQVV